VAWSSTSRSELSEARDETVLVTVLWSAANRFGSVISQLPEFFAKTTGAASFFLNSTRVIECSSNFKIAGAASADLVEFSSGRFAVTRPVKRAQQREQDHGGNNQTADFHSVSVSRNLQCGKKILNDVSTTRQRPRPQQSSAKGTG